MKLTSFVRPALRASSAPTTKNRSRSRAGPLKAGRVLRGHPSGLGLDRPEHGGRISQSGRKRAHSSKFKPLVFGYFHAAANTCSTFTAQTGFFHRRYPPPGSFPDLHLNLQKTLAALTTKSSAFFCWGGRPKRSAPAFPRRAASLAHSLLQRRLTAFIGKLVRSDGHLGSDLTRRHRLSA